MKELLDIAYRAGKEILKIYRSPSFEVKIKEDNSPLTEADEGSHKIIVEGLKNLFPDVPIISEEGPQVDFEKRKKWKRLWLVDPLDGTKEFIKRNGEFTINIALIENSLPSLGVIYMPIQDIIYYAKKGNTRMVKRGKEISLEPHFRETKELTAAVSRSHLSEKTNLLLKKLKVKDTFPAGSSLKFCKVAEGEADFYPRLGPNWEWDTAAGHCIAKAAGLEVIDFNGGELKYNKRDLKNNGFLVCSSELKGKILKAMNEVIPQS